MAQANNIVRILVAANVIAVLLFCIQSPSSPSNLKGSTDLFVKDSTLKSEDTSEKDDEISDSRSKEEIIKENFKLQEQINSIINRRADVSEILQDINPFRALGAYNKEYNLEYGKIYYNESIYGLSHDDDYCETVDMYNLGNPKNIFDEKNFFTDHSNLSLVRNVVIKELGQVLTQKIHKGMKKPKPGAKKIYLDYRINNFFTNHPNFHWYNQIGQNFLCATQMYNHIPGHTAFVNKGEILKHLNHYVERFEDRPQCFERDSFIPISYRLSDKEECKTFFDIINSEKYQKSLKTEPLQYLIKVTAGVHKAEGVSLLDKKMTNLLNKQYVNGEACGTVQQRLLAQRYISNPLLLPHHNKFDFRIYMLIASTNPLIVYYHDGFPRVSLHPYNASSNDKAAHFTNSAISNQLIKDAQEHNQTTIGNLSEDEVKMYKTWDVEDVVEYLLIIGKIDDPNWYDNYLRPEFQKALIHLIRMTGDAFWNKSNVYELNGVDFMLDDNLKLWYIESNPNPFLNSHIRTEFFPRMLFDLFEIQYAYYKSRMQRVLKVVRRFQKAQNKDEEVDFSEWREKYEKAEKNRLEPEYKISKKNGFKLIMDEGLEGKKAYFGLIEEECI